MRAFCRRALSYVVFFPVVLRMAFGAEIQVVPDLSLIRDSSEAGRLCWGVRWCAPRTVQPLDAPRICQCADVRDGEFKFQESLNAAFASRMPLTNESTAELSAPCHRHRYESGAPESGHHYCLLDCITLASSNPTPYVSCSPLGLCARSCLADCKCSSSSMGRWAAQSPAPPIRRNVGAQSADAALARIRRCKRWECQLFVRGLQPGWATDTTRWI